MAKVIQRIQVPTPTGLTATLQAGGSLPVGTTYYFRVVAFRTTYNGRNLLFHSAPTEEVSVTTTDTHRTITLSWDAVENAFGYAVQRTTSPGNYPFNGSNCFTTSSGRFSLTTLTSLTDDGSKLWNGKNPYLEEEAPLIEVYATAGETITSNDILQTAITNGWSCVKHFMPQGFLGSTMHHVIFGVFGSLYIRDCEFSWEHPIHIIQGGFLSDATVVYQDDTNDYYTRMLFSTTLVQIYYTNNNINNAGYYYNSVTINGTGTLRSFFYRRLHASGDLSTYYHVTVVSTGDINFIGGYLAHRPFWTQGLTSANAVYDGVCFGAPSMRYGVFRNQSYVYEILSCDSNSSAEKMVVRDGPSVAIRYFLNSFGVAYTDCVFPTDFVVYYHVGEGRTCEFCSSLQMWVVDVDGNPISDAVVEIYDANGLPAHYEDPGVEFTSVLNATDTYSIWNVTDGSVFGEGDIIRGYNYQEYMRVINVAGNSLTVERGYWGTTKLYHSNSTGQYRKVLKLKPYQSAINGIVPDIIPLSYVTYRGLRVAYNYNRTLAQLESEGYVEKTVRTPHTVKVSKPGYRTWTGLVDMTRPTELLVVLHTVEEPPYPWEVWHG